MESAGARILAPRRDPVSRLRPARQRSPHGRVGARVARQRDGARKGMLSPQATPRPVPSSARKKSSRISDGVRALDRTGRYSLYVLIPIETLKDALSAGWRVHARCIDGRVDNTRSTAKCRYPAELDVETLVWTRGATSRSPRSTIGRCARAAAAAASI